MKIADATSGAPKTLRNSGTSGNMYGSRFALTRSTMTGNGQALRFC
jgi:hypothetical protein